MKTTFTLALGTVSLLVLFSTSGCQSGRVGSPYQPGPVAGTAVGTGVGVVAGNVVGFGAGMVQGTFAGVKAVMDPSYRVVRQWRTETTSDGRTIQVPYDVLVDKDGRPVMMPAPSRP
jgi:hypothetical protein